MTLPFSLSSLDDPVKILGFSSPYFLVVAGMGLIVLTLSYFVYIKLRLSKVVRKIRGVRREIGKISLKRGQMNALQLEMIGKAIERNHPLEHGWKEFEETLVSEERRDEEALVFNTRSARGFFPFEEIVGKRINLEFCTNLPTLLTSVGLLLTFVAILLGLNGIDPDNTTEGVKHLVSNLSGKFLSSIIALLCACFFLWGEKAALNGVRNEINEFTELLDKLFPCRSAESILGDILEISRKQSLTMSQLGISLSIPIKESVQEGMGPLIERVSTALEELSRQRRESSTAAIEELLGKFEKALMGSAGSQFDSMSTSISDTIGLLAQMNRQSQESQERMEGLLHHLEQFSRQQSNASSDNVQVLAESVKSVVSSLQLASESSSNSVAEAMQRTMDRLEKATNEQMLASAQQTEKLTSLLDSSISNVQSQVTASLDSQLQRIQEQTDASAQTMKEVLRGLAETSAQASGSMSESIGAILQRLEVASNKQLEENRRQTEQLSSLVDAMVKRVDESMSASSVALQGTVNELLQQSRSLAQTNAESATQVSGSLNESASLLFQKIREMLQGHADSSRALSTGAEALERAQDALRRVMDEGRVMVTNTADASNQMKAVSRSFEQSLQHIAQLQDDMKRVTAANLTSADTYSSLTNKHHDLLSRYEEVFAVLDRNLSSVLGEVSRKIESYNKLVQDGLSKNLHEFDNHLTRATKSLGSTVEELNEGLESLQDMFGQVVR